MKPRLCIKLIFCVLSISLFLWGCGGGGSGGGGGGPAPLNVSGAVQAPNGQVAFYPRQDLFERFSSLFISAADASISGISPVADGTPVDLVRINDAGTVIATLASTTTSGGMYSFNLTDLGLSLSSDLIVQLKNSSTGIQMRAFVSSATVNIDPVSETAVRVILERISIIGPTLSDFTPQELSDLVGSIYLLTTVNQTTAGVNLETTVTVIENLVTADTDIMAFITAASGPGQTSVGPGDIGNFFPFTLGDTWSIQGTISTNGGTPTSFSLTEMITGTKVINGMATTVFTDSDPATGGSEENYFIKDSHAITYWGNNNLSDIVTPQLIPYQVVTFPLELNSTFQQVDKTGVNFGDLDGDGKNEIGNASGTVTIAAFEDVTVPVGSFANSVKIVTNTTTTFTLSRNGVTITTTGADTKWYAPGVGLVKRITLIQSQGGGQSASETETEELVGFIGGGGGSTTTTTTPSTTTTIGGGGGSTTTTSTTTTSTTSTTTPLPTVTFTPPTNFAVGAAPVSVAVGDFNGDGKPDLAVANSGSFNVSILLGDGTGSLGAANNFSVGGGPFSVAVGDFNGDGKLDLAVANSGSSNVSILLGDGTGSFGAATNFSVGQTPESVAIGDFNGDGKLDLAVANVDSNTVSILLGDGTGSFGAARNFGVGNLPRSIAIGDFNGDGKLDLAVANLGTNSNGVSILLGDGTGSFGAARNFPVGFQAFSVTVGDFNGDGKLDLAVGNSTTNGSFNVSILLGDGTGSFGAATNFPVGSEPLSVAVGDFNGDGKLDLAEANDVSNTVSILLGDGTGFFGAATDVAIRLDEPFSVVVGDFNRDGKLDLAVANAGNNTVSIFINTTP